MKLTKERLQRAFKLTKDLYESLEEEQFELKIPNAPSNSFGGQIWCIVGSRESYLKAAENGKWSGFSCSIQSGSKKKDILEKLDSSGEIVLNYLDSKNDFNDFEQNTFMNLLEHEIQHHGQLIRFVYSNKLKFPKSWNERYTVQE